MTNKRFATVREFAGHTRDHVLGGDWDQGCGRITIAATENLDDHLDDGCCVGVKLAFVLGPPHIHVDGVCEWTWDMGHAHAARTLNCTEFDIECLLQACGAGRDPFGGEAWDSDRGLVWDRLALIEQMPPFSQKFRDCDDGWMRDNEVLALVRETNRPCWQRLYGVAEAAAPAMAAESEGFWSWFRNCIQDNGSEATC